MNSDTLLLRQIHRSHLQAGQVASWAFRPSPKDLGLLSVYDGDLISPAEPFAHYTTVLGLTSDGVAGVTRQECESLSLDARPDPEPFPEHAVIDFTSLPRKDIERKSRVLRDHAFRRGWLYQPRED